LRPFPIRFRKDKTALYKEHKASIFGNDFIKTALPNFENLMDPIDKQFLENPINEGFFNKKNFNTELYKNMRNYGRKCR
jgi:hypothetical protein